MEHNTQPKLTEFEAETLDFLKRENILRWNSVNPNVTKALNRLVKKGYAKPVTIGGYVAWWEPL